METPFKTLEQLRQERPAVLPLSGAEALVLQQGGKTVGASLLDVVNTLPALEQSFLPPGTGGTATPYLSRARRFIEPEDYRGAAATLNDYGVDATDAIQKALNYAAANGDEVRLRAGTYKVGGTLTIPGHGVSLLGKGAFSTVLKSPNPANTILTIGTGLTSIKVRRMELTRAVTATAGGDGLATPAGYIDAYFEEIWSRYNYRGFVLGPTSFSRVKNLRAEMNVLHGIFQTNAAGALTISQWYAEGIYTGNNGGDGWRAQPHASAAGDFAVGELINFQCFANNNRGYVGIGTPASPLQSLRGHLWFLGTDGNDEVYLDTYGSGNQITDFFLEISGSLPTGPTSSVPASHIGFGLNATANTLDLQLANGVISGCAQSGLISSVPRLTVVNVRALNNGAAGGAGDAGFVINAGTADLVGCEAMGSPYGIVASPSGVARLARESISGTLAPLFKSGTGAVRGYSGWQSYVPTVTPGSGAFTGLGTMVGAFRQDHGFTDVELSLPITNNGTAATSVRVNLPVAPAAGIAFAEGRGAAVSNKLLRGYWDGTNLVLTNYDGTYPGATGEVLHVFARYRTVS